MRSLLSGLLVALAALLAAIPASAQEHDHDHEHDHGEFPEFVDVFFTHHAYLERKLHPRFQATVAEAGNEFEEGLELVWEFHPRFGLEVEAHATQTDPELGDGEGGFGDMEVAPILPFVLDADRQLIVSARSGFLLPTGDEDAGLGIDGWGWEPGLLVWKGVGAENQGAIQAELTYERLFLDEEPEDEESLVYNLAFSWWTESDFIPIVELNGVSPIGEKEEEPEDDEAHPGELIAASGGGGEAETDLVSATLGFRYAFANGQQWGAGLQLPINEDPFDVRLVVGGIIHLE